MATQITEQARSSLDSPQRTMDEARDLNSQRASSLLDPADFLPMSAGSGPTSPKTAAGRGFLRFRNVLP